MSGGRRSGNRAHSSRFSACTARNPAGIDTFKDMVGESLEVAFESGDSVVYRVLPEPAREDGGSA